jgi:hypothetical protein
MIQVRNELRAKLTEHKSKPAAAFEVNKPVKMGPVYCIAALYGDD